jgi:hypothetical protein
MNNFSLPRQIATIGIPKCYDANGREIGEKIAEAI